MFTQQVANYDQDLGVTTTGPMQMNWLLRSEAYAWYFLPPSPQSSSSGGTSHLAMLLESVLPLHPLLYHWS